MRLTLKLDRSFRLLDFKKHIKDQQVKLSVVVIKPIIGKQILEGAATEVMPSAQ